VRRVPPGPTALPGSMPQALRLEFGRTFRAPYEVPVVVAVNGLLMTGLWLWAPLGWKNALFSLHGPLAFALVLAGWMISDVPATNLLGPDARRMRAALDDPVMFRRLLYAKNLVLWVLIAPLCSVVALAVGCNNHDYIAMVVAIVAIVNLRRMREKELQAHQGLRDREMEHERKLKEMEIEKAKIELERARTQVTSDK